jgi:dynein heavy chain 1
MHFLILTVIDYYRQIDRLNLEGYANLDNWVAELDDRIAGILLQRLTQIIQVWCTEFNKADDGEIVMRDMTNKRRGEKRKEEKVRLSYSTT